MAISREGSTTTASSTTAHVSSPASSSSLRDQRPLAAQSHPDMTTLVTSGLLSPQSTVSPPAMSASTEFGGAGSVATAALIAASGAASVSSSANNTPLSPAAASTATTVTSSSSSSSNATPLSTTVSPTSANIAAAAAAAAAVAVAGVTGGVTYSYPPHLGRATSSSSSGGTVISPSHAQSPYLGIRANIHNSQARNDTIALRFAGKFMKEQGTCIKDVFTLRPAPNGGYHVVRDLNTIRWGIQTTLKEYKRDLEEEKKKKTATPERLDKIRKEARARLELRVNTLVKIFHDVENKYHAPQRIPAAVDVGNLVTGASKFAILLDADQQPRLRLGSIVYHFFLADQGEKNPVAPVTTLACGDIGLVPIRPAKTESITKSDGTIEERVLEPASNEYRVTGVNDQTGAFHYSHQEVSSWWEREPGTPAQEAEMKEITDAVIEETKEKESNLSTKTLNRAQAFISDPNNANLKFAPTRAALDRRNSILLAFKAVGIDPGLFTPHNPGIFHPPVLLSKIPVRIANTVDNAATAGAAGTSTSASTASTTTTETGPYFPIPLSMPPQLSMATSADSAPTPPTPNTRAAHSLSSLESKIDSLASLRSIAPTTEELGELKFTLQQAAAILEMPFHSPQLMTQHLRSLTPISVGGRRNSIDSGTSLANESAGTVSAPSVTRSLSIGSQPESTTKAPHHDRNRSTLDNMIAGHHAHVRTTSAVDLSNRPRLFSIGEDAQAAALAAAAAAACRASVSPTGSVVSNVSASATPQQPTANLSGSAATTMTGATSAQQQPAPDSYQVAVAAIGNVTPQQTTTTVAAAATANVASSASSSTSEQSFKISVAPNFAGNGDDNSPTFGTFDAVRERLLGLVSPQPVRGGSPQRAETHDSPEKHSPPHGAANLTTPASNTLLPSASSDNLAGLAKTTRTSAFNRPTGVVRRRLFTDNSSATSGSTTTTSSVAAAAAVPATTASISSSAASSTATRLNSAAGTTSSSHRRNRSLEGARYLPPVATVHGTLHKRSQQHQRRSSTGSTISATAMNAAASSASHTQSAPSSATSSPINGEGTLAVRRQTPSSRQ